MKRIFLTVTLLFGTLSATYAENYMIEVLPDKKVVHIDRLGMSDNTSLIDVLQMLPELISRGGDELFANYDIQYDGKSVGESRDILLEHTRLSELDKIEISSSPTVTQQKNGQSGVINLIPANLEKGFGGEAIATVSSEIDVMPNVLMNYKNDKLEIRGSVDMEYYQPRKATYTERYFNNTISASNDTTRKSYLSETARINMKFDFSPKDVLRVWLLESSYGNRQYNSSGTKITWDKSSTLGPGFQYVETGFSRDTNYTDRTLASAKAKYERFFEHDDKLSLYASYDYTKERTPASAFQPHEINAEAIFESHLLRGEKHRLELETGVNTTFKIENTSALYNNNGYISPYFQLKYTGTSISVFAGARYQYYSRYYSLNQDHIFDEADNDITANINTVWQICPHHALRLLLDRNLIRPDNGLYYPEMVKTSSGIWKTGNPDLKNTTVHTIDLMYITDWEKDSHSIVFNGGIIYNRADDIIVFKEYIDPDTGHFYNKPINCGNANIFNGNASLMYSHGIFSMTFAGNMFFNLQRQWTSNLHNIYYNLSLTGMFHFKKEWTLSAQFLYNSRVESDQNTIGDCLLARLKLNKTIKNWELFFEFNDPFDYTSIDVYRDHAQRGYSTYDLYTRYIGAGAILLFGNKRKQ